MYFQIKNYLPYIKYSLDKPAFSKLNDIHFFMEHCTILNDMLAWEMNGNRDPYECVDIDPDMLYELEHVSEKIA
ncbi:MAG: DUF2442 domain-containing protein [Eubacteriales bacterium]|nr:DUF2442 domain-containing protein [Eubacteriales bacterium]